MIHASSVLVIVGSVRQKRAGPSIAAWVAAVGAEVIEAPLELVDLKDWSLPSDEEQGIPAAGEYSCPQTLAWSRKIAEAGAIVLVSPQYNWGYPASLKNALDRLYAEWRGKPVMIVTYGGHGGDKCSHQLLQVCRALHMKPVSPRPKLRLARDIIEANAGEIDAAEIFAAQRRTVKQAFSALAKAR